MFLVLLAVMPFATAHAATWYVDNAATGSGNGTSWTNAWKSFSAIAWTSIKPGDTLYISGGSTSKTYKEKLSIGVNGTDSSPIYIKPGQTSPHNGVVTITNTGSNAGIYIANRSHIVVDGNVNGKQNIRVTKCTTPGVVVYGSAHGIVLTYLEVDNNGDAAKEDGISVQVSSSIDGESRVAEISYCKVHDNWQDEMKITGARGPAKMGRFLVHHNEIYNISDDGLESICRGIDFYNNKMHTFRIGKGSGHSDGIQFMGGSTRIYNNTFYNFSHPTKTGVNSYMLVAAQTLTDAIPERDFYIYNNLIYDTTPKSNLKSDAYLRGIEWTFGPSSQCTGVTNVIIANNTIIGTPYYGLSLWLYSGKTSQNVQIYNNIVSNCNRLNPSGGSAVSLGQTWNWTIGSRGDNKQVIFDHNIIYAGTSGSDKIVFKGTRYSYATWKSTFGTQKNITGNPDPLLNSQYRLQSTSPAKDKGNAMSSFFNMDIDAIARPQGTAWDIGASEYKTGTTTAAVQ